MKFERNIFRRSICFRALPGHPAPVQAGIGSTIRYSRRRCKIFRTRATRIRLCRNTQRRRPRGPRYNNDTPRLQRRDRTVLLLLLIYAPFRNIVNNYNYTLYREERTQRRARVSK